MGVAVEDLDEAMTRFGRLGVGRFATTELEFRVRYRGSEATQTSRIAYAPSGFGYVELVQPVSGPSPARAFLEERGEGAFHIGYWVDDVDEALRRCADLGLRVDATAIDAGGTQVAYLDARDTHGVHVELVRAAMRPMLEAWVAGVQ